MAQKIHILAVEDSAVDAELIKRELGKRDFTHTVKWVQSKEEFLSALGEFVPDMILCDYKMPSFDAFKALDIVKERFPETPFIVVSGTIGEDIAVEMMKSGAVDYVMKDKLSRLVPAIQRALKERQERTDHKKADNALRESEEKLRGILDNISIGVAVVSPDMQILSLNKQMKKWNPRIDLEDKPICYRAFNQPPRDEICSYCPTAKTLKDGLVHEDVTETPMGGQVFNYRIVASPIKDEHGKVVAVIEMVEDITGYKKAEKELQKRLQELEVFYKASIGREERILELKEQVADLEKKLKDQGT
ncbi:MAG: response regulator [Candidatus Omnitrophota bacterium]